MSCEIYPGKVYHWFGTIGENCCFQCPLLERQKTYTIYGRGKNNAEYRIGDYRANSTLEAIKKAKIQDGDLVAGLSLYAVCKNN